MKINEDQIIRLLKLLGIPALIQGIAIVNLAKEQSIYTVIMIILLFTAATISGIIINNFYNKENFKREQIKFVGLKK